MSFKEIVEQDIMSVFMNEMEFADTHNVEGKDIDCVIDNDNMVKFKNSVALGETQADMILFAKREDLPKKLKVGQIISLDAKQMIISSVKIDMGMAQIGLIQNIMS
jgi:hypothetical protein